jgi:hypothetical protein
VCQKREIFFGGPLTKAFWEGWTIPNFHSLSDRCWEPHPVLCSLNAGQLVINLLFKDTSRWGKSQPAFSKRQSYFILALPENHPLTGRGFFDIFSTSLGSHPPPRRLQKEVFCERKKVPPFSSRKTLPLNLWGVAPQADGEDTEKLLPVSSPPRGITTRGVEMGGRAACGKNEIALPQRGHRGNIFYPIVCYNELYDINENCIAPVRSGFYERQ